MRLFSISSGSTPIVSALFAGVLAVVISVKAVAADYPSSPTTQGKTPSPPNMKIVRMEALPNKTTRMANIGISGLDARWSNYGQYFQKLVDTVQIQWESLNERSETLPPTGTKVSVKFRLDSEGRVAEIIETESNGGMHAVRLCVSAITDRAPHGKWTDDMIAKLGNSQELTFTFHYGMPANANAASGKGNASSSGVSKASDTTKVYNLRELDQIPRARGMWAAPEYPLALKQKGITGKVILEFIVDTNGDVRRVEVVKSTNKAFNQPAIDAASRWKFHPGRRNGRLVNARMQVPITFAMTDDKQ